jgi:hypothetical protein
VEPAGDCDGRDGRWRIARRTVADRTELYPVSWSP